MQSRPRPPEESYRLLMMHRLPTILDQGAADELRAAIMAQPVGAPCVLDASDAQHIGFAALQVLLAAAQAPWNATIVNAGADVRPILEAARLPQEAAHASNA